MSKQTQVPTTPGMVNRTRGGHASRSAHRDGLPMGTPEFMRPTVAKHSGPSPVHDGQHRQTSIGLAHVTETTLQSGSGPAPYDPVVAKNVRQADIAFGQRSRRLETSPMAPGVAHAMGQHPAANSFHRELGRRIIDQAMLSGSTKIK